MEITILAFEGMTLLDAVGPFEVLGRLPGAHVGIVPRWSPARSAPPAGLWR